MRSLIFLFLTGNIFSVSELMGKIDFILKDGVEEEPNPLGVMTSEDRNKWAKVREHLVSSSERNQKSLEEIDTALFVLCLDDTELGTDPVDITRSFLHSDATNRLIITLFT